MFIINNNNNNNGNNNILTASRQQTIWVLGFLVTMTIITPPVIQNNGLDIYMY